MEKYSNNKLIKNLELKNISFEGCKKTLFHRYSYYQVINAYKSLFVCDTESIDDIYENIKNNKKIDEYKKYIRLIQMLMYLEKYAKRFVKNMV